MTWKRTRRLLAWIVGLYLAQMYVRMGWVKFDPEGFWTAAFERWNYPVWLLILVGVIEVAGGLLILIPWTASWGGLSLAVIMLGAWITRFNDGRMVDVAWITVYLLALLWIVFEWWELRWPRRPKSLLK